MSSSVTRYFPILLALVIVRCASPALPAERSSSGLGVAVSLLKDLSDPAAQADVLRGIHEGLAGQRHVAMPEGWHAIYVELQSSSSAEVRQQATALALVFGDPDAVAALHKTIVNRNAPAEERLQDIAALAQAKDPQLGPDLLSLLDDPAVRTEAIQSLSLCDELKTPAALLQRFSSFNAVQQHDAIDVLATRPAWAVALLDAAGDGRVPRAELSAFTIRQLATLNDKAVNERMKKIWGSVRPPAKDKAAQIAYYKKLFTPDMMAKADPSHGRAIFSKTCATCHTLFGTGGNIGPDLTGSQRANLDYVLENVVDPSAVVAKDYLMTVIATTDGRTLTGIIRHEDSKSLTLRTTTGDVILPINEIKHRKTSPISMMPEGLLEALSTEDARDLISYLGSPTQVPMKDGGH